MKKDSFEIRKALVGFAVKASVVLALVLALPHLVQAIDLTGSSRWSRSDGRKLPKLKYSTLSCSSSLSATESSYEKQLVELGLRSENPEEALYQLLLEFDVFSSAYFRDAVRAELSENGMLDEFVNSPPLSEDYLNSIFDPLMPKPRSVHAKDITLNWKIRYFQERVAMLQSDGQARISEKNFFIDLQKLGLRRLEELGRGANSSGKISAEKVLLESQLRLISAMIQIESRKAFDGIRPFRRHLQLAILEDAAAELKRDWLKVSILKYGSYISLPLGVGIPAASYFFGVPMGHFPFDSLGVGAVSSGGLVTFGIMGWVGSWRSQAKEAKAALNDYQQALLPSKDLGPGAQALHEVLGHRFGTDLNKMVVSLENFCQLGNPCELKLSEIAVLEKAEVDFILAQTARLSELPQYLIQRINTRIRRVEHSYQEIVKDWNRAHSPLVIESLPARIMVLRNQLQDLSRLFGSENLEKKESTSPSHAYMTFEEGRSWLEKMRSTKEIQERIELIEEAQRRIQNAKPRNIQESELLAFLENSLRAQQTALSRAQIKITELLEDKTSWVNWLQLVTTKAAILRAKMDTEVVPLLQSQPVSLDAILERLPTVRGELPLREE